MIQSNNIYIVDDRGIPSVVGNCPSCKKGDRSMILIDFVPNRSRYEFSTVYLRCICCNTVHQKQIREVTED